MIAIIDYDMGNVGSVKNMFKKVGYEAIITDDNQLILSAERIVISGVGSFDEGIKMLKSKGLYNTILEFSKTGKPILGICLGMQLLGNKSEEGNLEGLGLIDFDTIRFRNEYMNGERVPHMGWNYAFIENKSFLVNKLDKFQKYYFVHSFHANVNNKDNILMTSFYGYKFVSAVFDREKNIFGVQFHPEKSHKFGETLLKKFAEAVI